MSDYVYFDHNATTPVDDRVLAAMAPYWRERCGNPSSVHRAGRLARQGLDEARLDIATRCGVAPGSVVFTATGSEADNLALTGLIPRMKHRRVAVSALEHPAVLEAALRLRGLGIAVEVIGATSSGQVDLEDLARILQTPTDLVSVMAANNETGVIQPLDEVAGLVAKAGALLHVDAVQWPGKQRGKLADLPGDLVTLASHKIYGPKGAAALVLRKPLVIEAQIVGGPHERRRRAGTENVAAIVGFAKALALVEGQGDHDLSRLAAWRDDLDRLALDLGLIVAGQGSPRLVNTTCWVMPQIHGETLLMKLDLAGFAVSSGSACSSGAVKPSPVLQAMGFSQEAAKCSIRISLGRETTSGELDRFSRVLPGIIAALRGG